MPVATGNGAKSRDRRTGANSVSPSERTAGKHAGLPPNGLWCNGSKTDFHLVNENRVLKAKPATQRELKEQLRVARNTQKEAVKRFKEIVRDVPSGLPHPDGSDRIRNAARELSDAHSRMVALLVELNKISQDGDGKNRKP